MNWTFFLATVMLAPVSRTGDGLCHCVAETTLERQHRGAVKHLTNFTSIHERKRFLTPEEMYGWQDAYAHRTADIKTNPANPASARLADSPEDTMYTIKAYLWFVKLEENDCDMHIEIGPKRVSATRLVVEVPRENKKLQQKIRKQLDALGLLIMGCGTSQSAKAHFKKGIPVLVRGVGFYDASHKPNTNHGDAHTKKYSWELHPVVDVGWL
jgi:hypothetical protein